jgi:hypothetical protein
MESSSISTGFCPSIPAPSRHDRFMAPPSPSYDTLSLRLRRVHYQTGPTDWGEGVVTQHDHDSGMVTVMDTDDGSFWHGPEGCVEILA